MVLAELELTIAMLENEVPVELTVGRAHFWAYW
jgi:hypothetical protein